MGSWGHSPNGNQLISSIIRSVALQHAIPTIPAVHIQLSTGTVCEREQIFPSRDVKLTPRFSGKCRPRHGVSRTGVPSTASEIAFRGRR